jgi:hypothetical protein
MKHSLILALALGLGVLLAFATYHSNFFFPMAY